ncbi:hypothetical protein ACKAV7_010812 [Fusarium commune]
MSTMRVQIDPAGDVLVILPVIKSTAQSDPPNTDTPETRVKKEFLCSKTHLTLASPRAAKIFSSNFKEASKEADGFHHWEFEGIFDVKAFELVLKIIHGKTREIPQAMELDLLAGIASIVDDLECHDALYFFSQRWLVSLPPAPQIMDKTLA